MKSSLRGTKGSGQFLSGGTIITKKCPEEIAQIVSAPRDKSHQNRITLYT